MNNTQSSLLRILSYSLFSGEYPSDDFDCKSVLQEARVQSVFPIVYKALKDNNRFADTINEWKNHAAANLANNIRVINNHTELHKWLSGEHIPYVILKGCASAEYYPIPKDRAMGDVDFLVSTDDLDRAGKVLSEHGLSAWDEEHLSHIVYKKKGMHYEMHFKVAGLPEGNAGSLVTSYLSDVFSSARCCTLETGNAMLPSPFHHGLIILLHTCHHLTGEGVGLRHLCDWAVFSNSLTNEGFIDLFEEKLKAIGLWKFAQVLTLVSEKYLGSDHRKWAEISDCDELVDALMEDILSGGNFGIKDGERQNQGYLISSRGKNGVGNTGVVKQFFISMNNVVYVHWPFSRKWKIVLPFGWLVFGIRHLYRIITGKRRKVHINNMISGAKERRDIYSKLDLYKTGDNA